MQAKYQSRIGLSLGFLGIVLALNVSAAEYFPPAPEGWTISYQGAAAATPPTAALDGLWSHVDSDSWDGSAPGAGAPGGAGVYTEGADTYLRIQDTGDPRDYGFPDDSNRRIMFAQNTGSAFPSNFLQSAGATLHFRARLATTGTLDGLHPDGGSAVVPYPAGGLGYELHDGGTGNFGIFQETSGPTTRLNIGFTLDPVDGLRMNRLNGTTPNAHVDTADTVLANGTTPGGTSNKLALADPTDWNEFWISILPGGAGTHQVSVYMNGSLTPSVFDITAGNNDRGVSQAYFGMGATGQAGAIDVDFFNVYNAAIAPVYTPFVVEVDRVTGMMRLVNTSSSASPTIVGYEITSTLGALDRAAWKSIADNYDATPGGPGQIDSIGEWEILPEDVPYTEFSEFVFEDDMSGGVLAGNQQLLLGNTGAWIATPNESDLLATFTLEGGDQIAVPVIHTGNGGSPLSIIDLDADGGLPDAADWVTFRNNFRSDISLLTAAQAMRAGDLDGDLDIDLKDFGLFRTHWEAAYGLGSFATLLAAPVAVPELPSGAIAVLLLGLGCVWRFRVSRFSETMFIQMKFASRVGLTLGMLLFVPSWASAVTVTTLPMNRISDNAPTYESTAGAGATFTKPDNLLIDLLNTGNPRSTSSRSMYSPRNHGHSFTIVSGDFGFGINLDAIAINFEKRGTGATPDTFGFRVFKIASGDALANFVEPAIADVRVSATGLKLPTSTELSVASPSETNNGASGTALFNFDDSLLLEPGVYGFQFLPDWDPTYGAYTAFDWVQAPASYSDGTRWEEGLAGGTYSFGLVGSDATPLSARPRVEVNATNGEISLVNPATNVNSITLAGYELISPGNRLLNTWEGLTVSAAADAIGSGEGEKWEKAAESNSELLSELFLGGSSTLTPGISLSLGTAYLTGAQDSEMTFTYYNPILGIEKTLPVLFVGGSEVLEGDFNNDGIVNLADYTVWRDNLGGPESSLNGNGSGNTTVGSEDYDLWKANFGAGGGGALGASKSTNVPEPRAALLLGVVVAGFAAVRRRGLLVS